MKFTAIVAFLFFLSSCGGRQVSQGGVESATELHLFGEALVGLKLSVEGIREDVIDEDDLQPYPISVLGAHDTELERLEHVKVVMRSGSHRIVVSREGVTVFDRTMYFGDGQHREIRLNQ